MGGFLLMAKITHIVPEGHVCFLSKETQYYQTLTAGTHEIDDKLIISDNIPLNNHKLVQNRSFRTRDYVYDDDPVVRAVLEVTYDIIDPYLACIANRMIGYDISERLLKVTRTRIEQLLRADIPNIDKEYYFDDDAGKMILSGFERRGIHITSAAIKMSMDQAFTVEEQDTLDPLTQAFYPSTFSKSKFQP